MKRQYIILLLCLFALTNIFAQSVTGPQEPITFVEATTILPNPQFRSVLIAGINDMNADGLDDIIRLNQGRVLEYQLQLPNGNFETIVVGRIANKPQYSMCAGDLDGDGVNDLVIAGNGDGVKIIRNGSTIPELLPQSSFFAQGSNLVDINGDGHLDIFANNDTAANRIWLNDGLGNFTPSQQAMPLVQYQPAKMNGGNYASVWTDIDNDRDLDCFIAKCFVNPISNDPRLINQLYLNDGQNQYTETAASRGLDSDAQSWTADFQDIDNDGDLDCFLLNHYTSSALLINDGAGYFTDETTARGIRVNRNHFQCIFRDFDNDGWMDLIVAGSSGYEVYQNRGDGTFDLQQNIFSTYPMGTFAIGDLNHDGFPDVYSASANPVFMDKLWINEQNERNHYLGISLVGKAPRLNAIGARLYLYGPWGIQTREIRSGESYGIINSMDVLFGLGENQVVDSLQIDWPDGSTELFYNIESDQYIQIVQGVCLYPDNQISVDGSFTICPGEKVKLKAPAGLSYEWSDGSSERILEVIATGSYQVTVVGAQGCSRVSRTINIEVETLEKPVIAVDGATTFCEGEVLTAIAPDGLDDFEWSTGALGQELEITESGSYFLIAHGKCSSISSDPIIARRIDVPSPPKVANDTLSAPGNTLLRSQNEFTRWYNSEGELIKVGDRAIVPAPQTDTFYVSSFVEVNGLICESEKLAVYVVVDPTIKDKDTKDLTLRIFPNPSTGIFQVSVPRSWSSMNVLLFSMEGRLVWEGQLVTGPNAIELPDLPAGVYLLELENGIERELRRVVVLR